MIDQTIKKLTETLIQRGTKFDMEFLEHIYDDSLKFIRISPDNSVEILSKQDNIDFFQGMKDSNAKPLNTEHQILFADKEGNRGNIILKRKMQQLEKEQDFLFNISWLNNDGEWKIIREVVFLLEE
ncbi:hypothetical protein H318_14613 [Enterococcus durans IPLA 655]|uniref:hypothetical protein n=1 Tax=Enterococcus durans TaxID=53345 RepID=UPI0003285978|nr:hypothetical protein [Enterococcus durans]EMS74307.1 hypothetical protein H318_14613 [Enterococcus durans IPLA 655]